MTPTNAPTPRSTTTVAMPALERWARLTEMLATHGNAGVHLDTEDVVGALIDRSMVEEDMQAGVPFSDADLVRLARADQRYRAAAPFILDSTDIALFKDDEPPTHWWWHVEQLVLGHAGEQLLSVPDAAAVKGAHPHTIRAAIKDGRLPARRLARGFLIHRRDLERWQPRAVGRPRGSRPAQAVDTVLESFNEANTGGDLERAARLAETMERDPSTPRRCLAIALSAFNAGDDGKAASWASRSMDGDLPQASRQTALLVKGRALLRQGHPRKALRVLESARGLGFSDWLIDSALAEAYLECGQPARAVEVARRAAREAPDVPETHYLLARMLWHHDEPWEALERIIRFCEHRPEVEDAVLLHGSILGYLGDLTGQKHLYERARTVVKPLLDEGLPEAVAIEGQALGSLGAWRKALRAARVLIEQPDASGYWRHSAWHVARAAVEASGDEPVREQIIERAMRLLGRDQGFVRELAMLRAIRGDVDGTMEALGLPLERLHLADHPSQVIVALALLSADRGLDAFLVLASLGDDLDDVPIPIFIEAAIAAGEMDIALDAYRRFSERPDNLGRVAALGLRLLEHAELAARAGVSDSPALPFAWPWAVARGHNTPATQDSRWEGRHRRTSKVMDDVPMGPVH